MGAESFLLLFGAEVQWGCCAPEVCEVFGRDYLILNERTSPNVLFTCFGETLCTRQ